MVQIVKVETTEDKNVIITIRVNGKEMTHEINVKDDCIDCPMFIGQCAVNCYKLG